MRPVMHNTIAAHASAAIAVHGKLPMCPDGVADCPDGISGSPAERTGSPAERTGSPAERTGSQLRSSSDHRIRAIRRAADNPRPATPFERRAGKRETAA